MPLTHTTNLRVRFGETDAVGVANNAVYLQYFEIGRIELLRSAGHSYLDVHRDGVDMVVTEAGIRYLRPLVFDDQVGVECTLSELGRASFRFDYRLLVDGEARSTGFTRHACIDRSTMRPTRVPGWLHALA
jgi:acyl-CoA thioester hydrolase